MNQSTPIDLLSQREYVNMLQRGVGFTARSGIWYYLFSRKQIEPNILATLPKDTQYFIWEVRVDFHGEAVSACWIPLENAPMALVNWIEAVNSLYAEREKRWATK